ncbi:S-adenosyl-L-methionine-dependent methyltransferase [Aspergillus fijiensis CBS 313.89]|uniref:S-adenosyl-L-methionine-dependent methyltransferase n=1 Tax=Aspergillus fijiensis CBS 313.89 TaxID=1448319 RepID=A0A8G1RR86_9EURO|nr:S-adenosyl-L-methionine-dependent methyltransferase [Aspergillus fijiensis CBS 313.89]RAK77278.1 S-adenosyl-L-methionine-dependent methyltransferase [Aspergillus fijiensis CBS 313.89]
MVESNGLPAPATVTNGVDVDRIAVNPMAPEKVASLAQKIELLSKAFASGQADARLQLMETADALLAAVETPRETIFRYCWRNTTGFAVIETAIDLGIFRYLSNNDRPMSVAELTTATGADIVLLQRIMKQLNAIHAVTETDKDEYTSNNFSRTLTYTRYADAFPVITRTTGRAVTAIPEFLRKTGYRDPANGLDCPFQLGYNTQAAFFDFVGQDPVISAQFNNLMSIYHQGRASWMDPGFYPVEQRLLVDTTTTDPANRILLVDVGGGKGHDLAEFRAKWPNTPGRLILQDQPAVLAEVVGSQLHESIECMPHDFFTEQPCKGARAYFLHSVLHDWPDAICHKILAPLRAAMTPGYSRLLINENVIPDRGAQWQATGLDFVMLADFAGAERTESQWTRLLHEAGFRILRIWAADRWSESLIECEVVAEAGAGPGA